MKSILKKLTIEPVVFSVVFVLVMLFTHFEDPDFYWHIKTGEYIWSSSGFPRYDIFTYTNYGHRWVLSEWLSQVLIYLVWRGGGFAAMSLFVAAVYTLCWYFSYSACRVILNNSGKAIIATLLFCAFFGGIAPRPHVFTFLFFSMTMRLLVGFKYGGVDKYLVFIPLIMAFWANMHGGFFIGLILIFLFVVAEWIRVFFSREMKGQNGLIRLSVVAVFGLLATAINPDNFNYWVYPYDAIVNSGDMSIISEWRSPDFHMFRNQYFLAVVFVFFVCLIYSTKKPDVTELLLPLVFIAGSFISVRNLPLASLAMGPFFSVFYRELEVLDFSKRQSSSVESCADTKISKLGRVAKLWALGNKQVGGGEYIANWLLLVLSFFMVLLAYPSHKNVLNATMTANLPIKAVDFLMANHIQGRMFNTYHYGGYLIYRLHPAQRVFVYGRTDIYGRGYLKDYLDVYNGSPRWSGYFNRYKIDYVLCESAAPIRQLLLAGSEYKLVYDDGNHSVLLIDDKKYGNIIRKYSIIRAER